MNPLFTTNTFKNAKSTDKLPLSCDNCGELFLREKKEISYEFKHQRGNLKYCNRSCIKSKAKINLNCVNCNRPFFKYPNELPKSVNHFCSKSCNTSYNNKNKKFGYKRSKLEAWLEDQLLSLYPNLEFHFNRKDAIGSELDIYIPSLSLAFELNGPFHYEPIFGETKLQQIKFNDILKIQACAKNKIELHILDVSKLKYFKPKNAQKYLDIINEILNQNPIIKKYVT